MFGADPDENCHGRESLIRIGEVTSIDPSRLTARVTFDDDDGVTSFDLPILQRNTLKNRDYATVDVGEDVVCVFLPSGVEEGFIIGTLYAGEIVPPQSSADVRCVEFEDGTVLKYDRSAHKLSADINGDADVKLTGKADVTASGEISITSLKSVTIMAPEIKLMGAVASSNRAGGTGKFTVTGHIDATGTIISDTDVKAAGISLKTHTHTCPDGSTSGPN